MGNPRTIVQRALSEVQPRYTARNLSNGETSIKGSGSVNKAKGEVHRSSSNYAKGQRNGHQYDEEAREVTQDMIPTDIVMRSFMGEATNTRGILPVDVTVGSQVTLATLFVVKITSFTYNALLRKDWIHVASSIPSSLHQMLLLWNRDEADVMNIDLKLFMIGVNAVEVVHYHSNIVPHWIIKNKESNVDLPKRCLGQVQHKESNREDSKEEEKHRSDVHYIDAIFEIEQELAMMQ
ncbi:hypothetical protein ACH5RR_003237 [Cinchona calisaya]|uniref:Uncharacterized protein n=1 Tax=Cinchona calisaya TaxID=153742 RepID=A0ABD3AU97_9GENT